MKKEESFRKWKMLKKKILEKLQIELKIAKSCRNN